MRWLIGFVLLLLGLGTLRMVGCGEEDRSCVDAEDCDDGNPCTRDSCVSYDPDAPITCDVVRRCRHWPEDDGTPCGSGEICVDGVCGENLCKDVVCDDGLDCTEGECDLRDGKCYFTNLCDDDDDCTKDICNPENGLCDFTTLAEDGTGCGLTQDRLELIGVCEAGVCVGGACDPESTEVYECPIGEVDYFCCPGWGYCIFGDPTCWGVPP
ncbi:MAG: hypothetical protein JSW51_10405 [Gemmatimonadota bacterium]|nr:MAG: hypothetical protein JSW51_10405 [Gemmatimonadota bacterium]